MPFAAVRRRPRPPHREQARSRRHPQQEDAAGRAEHHTRSRDGAGRWTDDQLVRAIRQGISHDGRRLSVVMPYPTLSILTDDDVQAIVAYLDRCRRCATSCRSGFRFASPSPRRTRRGPRRGRTSSPRARAAAPTSCTSRAACTATRRGRPRVPITAPARHGVRRRPALRDEALFDEIDDDPVRPPAEAARLDPPSFRTSPNITPDPSGIPYFDEAIFIRTIRSGRVAGSAAHPRHALVRVPQAHR